MPYTDRNKKRENNRKWYKLNREKRLLSIRAWNKKNKDKLSQMSMQWAKDNPERSKEINKRSAEKRKLEGKKPKPLTDDQKKRKSEQKKIYRKANREKINKDEYNRYRNDISFRLRRVLRARLRDALKSGAKHSSAVESLGCTLAEFKVYLEGLWDVGMSWDNYGRKGGWQIDHKLLLCSFYLEDKEQYLIACNYRNTQPLWESENVKKQQKELREKKYYSFKDLAV